MKKKTLPMIVQHSYIMSAIEHNDAGAIEYFLHCACPIELDGDLPASNTSIAILMLEYASASEGAMLLSEEIAILLIDYLAMRVAFGNFLQLFLRRCRFFCSHNLERLDPAITEAVNHCRMLYSDKLAEAIKQLDEDQFVTLMNYIQIHSGPEFEDFVMSKGLFLTSIRYIYDHELIPRECIFAYMRMCL